MGGEMRNMRMISPSVCKCDCGEYLVSAWEISEHKCPHVILINGKCGCILCERGAGWYVRSEGSWRGPFRKEEVFKKSAFSDPQDE
jgi:hypothetical protein